MKSIELHSDFKVYFSIIGEKRIYNILIALANEDIKARVRRDGDYAIITVVVYANTVGKVYDIYELHKNAI